MCIIMVNEMKYPDRACSFDVRKFETQMITDALTKWVQEIAVTKPSKLCVL